MKKVIPKSSKRSFEVIAMQNPSMTCKEAMEEHKYDLACYDMWKKEQNKSTIQIMEWLNENRYLKITYKNNPALVIYFEITNAYINNDYMFFDGYKSQISNVDIDIPNQVRIYLLQKLSFESWDSYRYGSDIKVLTKKEYDTFINAVTDLYNINN